MPGDAKAISTRGRDHPKPNGVKFSCIFGRLPFEFGWDSRMRRLQALRTSPSRKLRTTARWQENIEVLL